MVVELHCKNDAMAGKYDFLINYFPKRLKHLLVLCFVSCPNLSLIYPSLHALCVLIDGKRIFVQRQQKYYFRIETKITPWVFIDF